MKLVQTIDLTQNDRETLTNLSNFIYDLDYIEFDGDEFDGTDLARIGEFIYHIMHGHIQKIYKKHD